MMMGPNSSHKKSNQGILIASILTVLLLLLGYLYARLYLQATNTLENNGRWISTKASLEKGVVGAVAYVVTPVAMHRGELNLGALFGFQEVLFKKQVSPRSISFRLKLPQNSFMTFIYNKGDGVFSGIRLSRNSEVTNTHLEVLESGKFRAKFPLASPQWSENWNDVKIEFGEEDVQVFLNKKLIGKISESLKDRFLFGFRGGPVAAVIDDVQVVLRNGDRIEEDFQNDKNFWKAFGGAILLLGLANGLMAIWARRKKKKNPDVKVFYYLLSANLLLLLLQPMLYTAQYYCLDKFNTFSKIYFKAAVFFRGIPSTIETRDQVVKHLSEEHPIEIPPSIRRILFIGTSQTWGAGATHRNENFVKRLEQALNRPAFEKPRYELINGGISGEKVLGLFDIYSADWIRWRPEWVILNLSNNDLNSEKFSEGLEKFLHFNQENGVRTAFILEANTVDSVRENLPENHRIMRETAARWNVPIFDLHSCLAEKRDDGFLWWDFVHLTSYGQEEAAHCLQPFLEGLLR